MGKKGSKRKTRWRTLSIGDPPGEEDEEDGLRNGYAKSNRENESSTHSLDRNDQSGYKPRRIGTGSAGGTTTGSTSGTSGYGSGGQRFRREESTDSPSQPKIIFNEDEYTKITTPRQDVLFKKGYLSKKKPWASNASTSATPSTTESQSASHSTADGSETTEDQQLLDRDTVAGEYPPVVEPGAQLSYGTFYDHTSGYYYEYPVMLVGPAPIPAQVGPSVLAAVPCGPVPLRPIEWINPAFVPKLSGQPYCVMDYQAGHGGEVATIVDGQESAPPIPVETTNGVCNESGTGSASCSGSVAGETEERTEEVVERTLEGATADRAEERTEVETNPVKQHHTEQQYVEMLNIEENGMNGMNGMNGGPYMEPILMQQPVHVSHVVPAMPQPYMYPGHYMFGPPLVNVNGVTLQGGPMIRTTDVAAMAAACAKRRKKKKRRKQRRPALGNTEDDEEEEYSSECDNGLLSSRLAWSVCSSTTTTVTTTVNRPLNPECQEFQFRPLSQPIVSTTATISDDAHNAEETSSSITQDPSASAVSTNSASQEIHSESNGSLSTKPAIHENEEETTMNDLDRIGDSSSREDASTIDQNQSNDLDNETDRLPGRIVDEEQTISTKNESQVNPNNKFHRETRNEEAESRDSISANEECHEDVTVEFDDGVDKTAVMTHESHTENHTENHTEKVLLNGEIHVEHKRSDKSKSKSKNTKMRLENEDSSLVENTSKEKSSRKDDVPFDDTRCVSSTPKMNSIKSSKNVEQEEPCKNSDRATTPTTTATTTKSVRKKYSAKGAKFVREPTPGPDLEDATSSSTEHEKNSVVQNTDSAQLEENDNNNSNVSNTQEHTQNLANETSEEIIAIDTRTPNETTTFDSESKNVSDGIVECSTEDSGFDSQSRTSDYPITKAVTEWLQRANSPDMFVKSTVSSDSETEDDEDLGEEVESNEKPPKNLQGNPMPALSVNSGADNNALSRTASCGEFARASNVESDQLDMERRTTSSAVTRRKKATKSAKRKAAERNAKRTAAAAMTTTTIKNDGKSHRRSLTSTDSENADRNATKRDNDVGDVCEFTEEDSIAGMRVATSSRMMDSKRVNVKRTRKSAKYRELAENVDVKIRRIGDGQNEDDEGIVEDTVSVKTYEKGEIVVSVDGKLLPISSYETIVYDDRKCEVIEKVRDIEIQTDITDTKREKNRSTSEEENDSVIASLNSIEEPDVLECWEAETIEPVITPKRMLQSHGISYDGEAAEEDNVESNARNIEHVQKYYRLARESTVSVEEELSERCADDSSVSCMVPNKSVRMIESFYTEEIPVILPSIKQTETTNDQKVPVDEAFEVYESCYTGKTPPYLAMDPNILKPRPLYKQDGEGPMPCKAVCCNIQ